MAENIYELGNNSPALSTIQGEQPSLANYAFRDQCRKILEQYTPLAACSPKVLSSLDRINSISETLLSCTIETHSDLSHLSDYIQTCHETHLGNYSLQANACDKKQLSYIHTTMGHEQLV